MCSLRGTVYRFFVLCHTKGEDFMAKESFSQRCKNLWGFFTAYEKIWFFSILILAFIFAFLFPEEDVNGVNGTLIMGLYLADTFLHQ